MNTYSFGNHSIEEIQCGIPNMREYRHTTTGRIWLVRVEVEYNFDKSIQCISTYVDGYLVNVAEWNIYRSGKMQRNQLPLGWGKGQGFEAGMREIKRQLREQKASA